MMSASSVIQPGFLVMDSMKTCVWGKEDATVPPLFAEVKIMADHACHCGADDPGPEPTATSPVTLVWQNCLFVPCQGGLSAHYLRRAAGSPSRTIRCRHRVRYSRCAYRGIVSRPAGHEYSPYYPPPRAGRGFHGRRLCPSQR